MEHDLLVAVVAVDGFGARLPVSHVQPTTETAGTTKSVSNRIVSVGAEAWSPSHGHRIYCVQTHTLGRSPFKVVELYFLSEELEEFHKGRTLVVVSKQFLL